MTVVFKVSTIKGMFFKYLFETLKGYVKELNFVFTPEGIKVTKKDQSKLWITYIFLEKDKFESYYASGKYVVGINVLEFHKFIKSIGGKDRLTLSIEDDPQCLTMILENSLQGKTKRYDLPLLNLNEPIMKKMEITCDHKITYSNLGYVILGGIIEVASGTSYFDNVQKRIVDKLDLKETYLNNFDGLKDRIAIGYLYTPLGILEESIPLQDIPNPDGGFLSTSEDIMKFYRSYYYQALRYFQKRQKKMILFFSPSRKFRMELLRGQLVATRAPRRDVRDPQDHARRRPHQARPAGQALPGQPRRPSGTGASPATTSRRCGSCSSRTSRTTTSSRPAR